MNHRKEAVLALYDGDVLAVWSTCYGKSLIYELIPLLKLKSIQE